MENDCYDKASVGLLAVIPSGYDPMRIYGTWRAVVTGNERS